MSCVRLPAIPVPTLPAPLTIAPPSIPDVPGIPGLCCKLPPIPFPPIPLSLPALLINPAVVNVMNAYVQAAVAYIHALPLKCPVE